MSVQYLNNSYLPCFVSEPVFVLVMAKAYKLVFMRLQYKHLR